MVHSFAVNPLAFWSVIVCMACVQAWILRRLRFDWFIVAMVLAGTLLCAEYLTYTSITERNYDGTAHLHYLRTIAEEGRLPDARACVACGHPPLYYALAALWARLIHAGAWVPWERGLACFSLALSFGFMVFALSILRNALPRTGTFRLAAALVIFWPSTIINSVRVHNDALASLLLAAFLYFFAEWDKEEQPRHFYAALVAATLAILTKASGFAAAATLLLFALGRVIGSRGARKTLVHGAIALVVLGSVALVTASFRSSDDGLSPCQKVLGRACDPRRTAPVEFTVRPFLGFDLKDFVQHTDSIGYESDDEYVLNRLIKSSLFGIDPLGGDFAGTRKQATALIIRLTLLAMAMLVLVALPFLRDVAWKRFRALGVASVIFLIFLLAFRLRLPNAFHEDFRHIFPVLVPLCLVYAKIVERVGQRWRPLTLMGMGLGMVMAVSQVMFFVR